MLKLSTVEMFDVGSSGSNKFIKVVKNNEGKPLSIEVACGIETGLLWYSVEDFKRFLSSALEIVETL